MSVPLHIVMLTNNALADKTGGLERYVSELSEHLVAQGARVTLVAKRRHPESPADEVAADGVRIIRHDVPLKGSKTFAARYVPESVAGVRRALHQAGPADVVHAHFPIPALAPFLSRTPYVYTLHAPVWRELLVERQGSYFLPAPLQGVARATLRRVERSIVRRADVVLTLSDFMRREVATLDAVAGRKVELVAGGIDTSRFDLAEGDQEESTDGPVLFTARRLVPRTGVQQLVSAMAIVHAKLPGARLNIAGDGLQRQAISDEIDKLGLGGVVSLLGRISEEELVSRYQSADLAVTPTQELEGFGLSTAEALACGTPCLVTPVGANPEVVAGVSPQLTTRDASADGIAEGILRWFETAAVDDGRLTPDSCRAAVHPSMSWPEIAQRHLQVYRRSTGGQR